MKKLIFSCIVMLTGTVGASLVLARSILVREYFFFGPREPFTLLSAITIRGFYAIALPIMIIVALIGFILSVRYLIEKQDKNAKDKIILGCSMFFAGSISAAILFEGSIWAGRINILIFRIRHPYFMCIRTRFWHISHHQLQLPLSILAVIALIGIVLCFLGVWEAKRVGIKESA